MPVQRDTVAALAGSLDAPKGAQSVAIVGDVATFKVRNYLDKSRRAALVSQCEAITGYPASRVRQVSIAGGTVAAEVFAIDESGRRIASAYGGKFVRFWVFRPIVEEMAEVA